MSKAIDEALYAASDYSLFGPESLEDIRCRLSFIEASECNCDEGPHENALHDLAHDDVPALLVLLNRLSELTRRLEQGARRYRLEGRPEKAEGIRWALATILEMEEQQTGT